MKCNQSILNANFVHKQDKMHKTVSDWNSFTLESGKRHYSPGMSITDRCQEYNMKVVSYCITTIFFISKEGKVHLFWTERVVEILCIFRSL